MKGTTHLHIICISDLFFTPKKNTNHFNLILSKTIKSLLSFSTGITYSFTYDKYLCWKDV